MWIVNLASLTFWMNVLIAHAGWINYPLGVLWSLSVEETFYATFPLICLLLRREKHLVLFWLVLIVMAPLYRLTHQGDEAQCLYAYAACSDAIAIGCITALIVRDGRLQILQTAWIQAATIAAMATLYAAAPIAAPPRPDRHLVRPPQLRTLPVPPDRARRLAHVFPARIDRRQRKASDRRCLPSRHLRLERIAIASRYRTGQPHASRVHFVVVKDYVEADR
jgi:hypothetical protein